MLVCMECRFNIYIQLFEDIFKWIKDIFKSFEDILSFEDIFIWIEDIFKWYYL